MAYVPDLQPIFAQDCVSCHNNTRADGGYNMQTLAAVMTHVRPGDPTSSLVHNVSPGRGMYKYWTGNAQAKADLVYSWVVTNKAAASR